ncbi:MAG: type VI secretion system baseplate subunit TssE [Motiliproteus sp.]
MSAAPHGEKLLPSLLDRLTDEHPELSHESAQHQNLSLSRLREALLRDLAWLLNTTNLQTATDLSSYEEVQRSVVNFGIPEFSGVSASTLDVPRMERALRTALLSFEPRIANSQLSVRVVADESKRHQNSIAFLIEGEIWAQPVPLSLHLETEMDLESGNVVVKQKGR